MNHQQAKFILHQLVGRVKCHILAKRFHSTQIDFNEALEDYEAMVFVSNHENVATKEYKICKTNFELSFRKELEGSMAI